MFCMEDAGAGATLCFTCESVLRTVSSWLFFKQFLAVFQTDSHYQGARGPRSPNMEGAP